MKGSEIMEVENLPNAPETIEKLARQLERARTLTNLKACQNMDDVQALIRKYEALCQEIDD